MDHKEQRQEHHRHEREKRKKEKKRHEREQEGKSSLPVHPLWLVIVGVVLTFGAVLTWVLAF